MLAKLMILLVLAVPMAGCEEWQDALKTIETETSKQTEYEAPPGESAAPFFAITTAALKTDSAAVLEALGVGVNEKATANLRARGLLLTEEATPLVTDDAAAVLAKIRAAKKNHNPDSFVEDDNSVFTPAISFKLQPFAAANNYLNDTVTLAEDEYVIPVLDKMPVRDQGGRGTCSSFAGIGQIEGLVLATTSLDSIDLSEQRFYAMSKPDHWADGGAATSGGSNAGTGFGISSFLTPDYDPGFPDPATYNISNTFNIPLETDCPYNDELGANDLQSPDSKNAGCSGGVVQVTNFQSWHHGYDSFVIDHAQSIYDHLKAKGYPVLVSSKLSDNWENNDGIITWADTQSAGSTNHASGHAYLIVGTRKLDETAYPGEGGMCFIIKNSWGKGWGVNGLSCMTLTWWNNHRYNDGYPVALAVSINESAIGTQVAQNDQEPEELTEPDESKKTIADDPDTGGATPATENTNSRPRGKIKFGYTNDRLLLAEDFTYGRLLSNEDSFHKILYRVVGDVFYMRGILTDGKSQTNNLTLRITDSGVLHTNFKGKGSVEVGKLDASQNLVVLCSQEYDEVCHFNYLKDSSELVVGISRAELLSDPSTGPYDWHYLGAGGKGIEVSFPEGFSTRVDVRLTDSGQATNPLRFRIEPLAGTIKFQGEAVGDYQSGELCSGSYRSRCTLVRTTEQFLILFKSKKGTENQ